MRRLIKWFIWPALAMLASIALVAAGYHHLLQAPATTIRASEAAAQQANLAHSEAVSGHHRSQIAEADLTTLLNARLQTQRLVATAGVGRVAIPKVGISLPIFNQINDSTLSLGTVLYFPERKLGQGNTVLASHHYLGSEGLLNALNQVKKGDEILVSDLTTVWRYQVAANQVVKQDQVSVLANTGDARVTLIRCEGPRGTDYRRVVTGLLTRRTSLTAKPAKSLGITFSNPPAKDHGPLAFVAAAIGRTMSRHRLDGWLWLLLAINLTVLLACGAGYVLAGDHPHKQSRAER